MPKTLNLLGESEKLLSQTESGKRLETKARDYAKEVGVSAELADAIIFYARAAGYQDGYRQGRISGNEEARGR